MGRVLFLDRPDRVRRPLRFPTAVVLADAAMRSDFALLVRTHRRVFERLHLVAWGRTREVLMVHGRVHPSRLRSPSSLSGSPGTLDARRVDAVIHLRDPDRPLTPAAQAFIESCDRLRIPLATNPATAGIVLRFLGWVLDWPEAGSMPHGWRIEPR